MAVQGLVTSFEGLMDSKKYSNLTIKCGSQDFIVHRAIVCACSKPLVDDWRQLEEIGVIELNEDLEMVKKMIQFLYTMQYDNNREAPLLTNTPPFVLGDIYDIPGRRQYTKSRYEEIVKDRWNNKFFSQSIHLAYEECTGGSLKGVMVQTAHENIKFLVKREDFLQLLTNFADFASCLQASVASTAAASEAS